LVFVHGSWPDHHSWDLLLPELAPEFQILTYDRRGHSASERLAEQGNVNEDVLDLATLVKQQGWNSAHFIGNSFGGTIVLKLAALRPEIFQSLSVHEPPLFTLLDQSVLQQIRERIEVVLNHIRSGDSRAAAWNFVENVAIGPGGWETLTREMQETMIFNAPTFLDEAQDPNSMTIDLQALANFKHPVMLTQGDQSPPIFAPIVSQLAATMKQARVVTIPGCGHIPQITHPREYAELIRKGVSAIR
jgi:pimeloyl-ACP methyl ester carboxylesterase